MAGLDLSGAAHGEATLKSLTEIDGIQQSRAEEANDCLENNI